MSVILLPDKWRRQPNGPVLVNLAHPLASKISYAIVAGVDLLNPSLSQLTFAENNIYGRVFRGSSPHKVSADTAESTVIGHHYYAGDNNDYAALSWGFYVSAGNNSQLGIGMGPITGSSIYAVNRANSAGSTELEPSITFPYSAIWAITGTLGSGAAAKAYKNGVYFANVAQSGSGTFSQSTSRTFDSYLSSSSGKASAWNYKFNRILPPEEIRELSNAPYQILVKTPRILYFDLGSGGGATTHATSGALAGGGAAVDGAAARERVHATAGVLAGAGGAVDGAAARERVHATTGVLAGAGAAVDGASARTGAAVTHATTGALAGGGAAVDGAASRTLEHATSGALAGAGAAVDGSAHRTLEHATSGVLAGAGGGVDGSAARERIHSTTGVLAGAGGAVDGSAARLGAAVTHETSGAISGGGATLAGSALNGVLDTGGGGSSSKSRRQLEQKQRTLHNQQLLRDDEEALALVVSLLTEAA